MADHLINGDTSAINVWYTIETALIAENVAWELVVEKDYVPIYATWP